MKTSSLLALLIISVQFAGCWQESKTNQTPVASVTNNSRLPANVRTSAGNTSTAPSSPTVLVGIISEIRVPFGSYPVFGPGIQLSSGQTFVSSVEIRKDMMTASPERVATELDMRAGEKNYTIRLNKYRSTNLSILAGATIKVTGMTDGNIVYATEINTVKKPEETKYVEMRTIATPVQKK